MQAYRSEGFPVTIVRPSHTYCERSIPMGVHGNSGSWPIIRRMQEGKPVIVHGDGSSLWTFTFNTDFAKGFCGLMGNVHAIGEAAMCIRDRPGVALFVLQYEEEVEQPRQPVSRCERQYSGSLCGSSLRQAAGAGAHKRGRALRPSDQAAEHGAAYVGRCV